MATSSARAANAGEADGVPPSTAVPRADLAPQLVPVLVLPQPRPPNSKPRSQAKPQLAGPQKAVPKPSHAPAVAGSAAPVAVLGGAYAQTEPTRGESINLYVTLVVLNIIVQMLQTRMGYFICLS